MPLKLGTAGSEPQRQNLPPTEICPCDRMFTGVDSASSHMFLLQKVIQLREKAHPDHEKPFLEHLEDLRVMITRVVITLVISMGVCFVYNHQLMAFFRKPVDAVILQQLRGTLPEKAPKEITPELWKEALKVEQTTTALNPTQREVYFRYLKNPELIFHSHSIGLLRAAMNLPTEQRVNFVNSLDESAEMKGQVKALIESKPNTESRGHGDLNMMSALKPTEGFMLSMSLSFVAGIVLSFPLLLYFILQFILPGLHSHEKRVMWPAITIGFGLFLMGASFAYFLVLPKTLLFFYNWSGDMGISNDWRIGEYISFATQFTLLFGASFELPVVVMVFVKLGLLTYETMSKTRSYAIVAIFIAAAVLTPTPDIPTMLLMASPMIVLYEICIWLAYFDRKKARIREEQEAREQMEARLQRQQEMRDREHAQAASDDHSSHHHDVPTGQGGDDGWHVDLPENDAPADFEAPLKLPRPEEEEDRRRDDG
jgi:sec-independent protein translocase protein TatC